MVHGCRGSLPSACHCVCRLSQLAACDPVCEPMVHKQLTIAYTYGHVITLIYSNIYCNVVNTYLFNTSYISAKVGYT